MLTIILGGSTNAVLHLIAVAHSVGIELTIDDFQSVSDRVPFIADLKPSGKYVFEDVYKIGGIPSTSRFISLFFAAVGLVRSWVEEVFRHSERNTLCEPIRSDAEWMLLFGHRSV